MTDRRDICALFPPLSPLMIGGIEASGRLAQAAIQEGFGPHAQSLELQITDRRGRGNLGRKVIAGLRVLAASPPSRAIFLWHIGFLPLLPAVGGRQAKAILFLHGVEAWKPLSTFSTRLLHKIDLFLSNSEYTWQRFLTLHPDLEGRPHRTVQLGYGVPVADSPRPGTTPAAVMMSRLMRSEDYKGHRQVIRVWPKVRERIDNPKLVIIGDGDLRPHLETLAKTEAVADSVRFTGFLSEADKIREISKARCLVLPSDREGFGIAYVEAMRLGRPCLVSTLDAGQEVVNPPEAGLSVDPRDEGQLTGALEQLMQSGPEWSAWSRASQERYERYFTARHFKDRLVASIADCVG